MIFKFKKPAPKPAIIKMVVPGRRALGETWREITVRPNEDGSAIEMDNQPALVAPATNVPVVIPAMGNLSNEEVNFILEGALAIAERESRKPRRRPVTDAEVMKWAEKLWGDYLENKIKNYEGTSQFGPYGKTQREKPPVQNFNPRSW